jgi:Arc/MetJ-type ribon-helix-helix transcriptional regulator
MQLNLQPDLQRFVDEQVQAGLFPTPEAVVEAALRNEMAAAEPADEDLAAIDQSQHELDAGQQLSFNDFAARMRKKHGIS